MKNTTIAAKDPIIAHIDIENIPNKTGPGQPESRWYNPVDI